MLIDRDKAVELLNEAVAEKGADYIYETPSLVVLDATGVSLLPPQHPDSPRKINGYAAWAFPQRNASRCLYVHTDGDELYCGCIVGNALHRAGVPLMKLIQNENAAALCHNIEQDDDLDITITDDARLLFDGVQAKQDGRGGGRRWPWGEAVQATIAETVLGTGK